MHDNRDQGRPDAAAIQLVPAYRAIGWALTLSMAGIALVSLLYALSPPALVAPIVPIDVFSARIGAASTGSAIRWSAPFGLAADPVAAAACAAIGVIYLGEARTCQAIGWLLLGFSSLLFVLVDAIAGTVLAPLGRAGKGGGLLGAKLLFDNLFIAGTLCLAIGLLCLACPRFLVRARPPGWLHYALALDGLLGLVSAYALLAGQNWALALGGSVGLASAVLTVVGTQMLSRRNVMAL